ncbi:uncharacterized protein B0H64DRAFT_403663 [Chaetomium fimeti]|uniref:Uncharacterized protein n=1 Tax=Chaetomium fimeti TaxID=1854472 RepID=A0AAE0HAY0_9PEZI|nr:hypothetical protein B0H64DRAFT_403663 [Chaetomium fimeti]
MRFVPWCPACLPVPRARNCHSGRSTYIHCHIALPVDALVLLGFAHITRHPAYGLPMGGVLGMAADALCRFPDLHGSGDWGTWLVDLRGRLPPPPAHAMADPARACPRGGPEKMDGSCLPRGTCAEVRRGHWQLTCKKPRSGTALSSGEYATHQCYPGNSQSDDVGKNAAPPSRADFWVLFPSLRLVNGAARLRVESAGNLDQRFHGLRTDRQQDLLNLLLPPLPHCR